MTPRTRMLLLMLAVLAAVGAMFWRSELFTVQKSGASPAPIALIARADRDMVAFDVSLPVVPVGVQHLTPGGGVQILQYWAPWMRHSGPQATGLDSLRRLLPPGAVRVAVICFDPFPSVSRYVARMRLRLPVLLDQRRRLAAQLPAPSIPFTYVLDAEGRVAARQAGEVDWLSAATRAAIDSLIAEPPAPAVPALPKPAVL